MVCNELRALEESLLQPAVRRDRARVAELLADEFCEFGSSGRVFSKAEILEELQGESKRTITMEAFACAPVGEDAMLVTYRSVRVDENGNRVEALRSSVWVRREGRWQMVFHQGTKVSEAKVAQ